VGALQLHLIRSPVATRAKHDAVVKSLVLAGFGALIATAALLPTIGAQPWLLAVLAGGVVSSIASLGASLQALGGRFGRAAGIDIATGALFGLATLFLVASSAPIEVWAGGYLAVWLATALVCACGPLSFQPFSGVETFGSFGHVLRGAATMIAIGFVAMAFNRSDFLALTIVGSDTEATRYALAGRIVGPIMVALGSLNNSLYVRQIQLDADPRAVSALTRRTSRAVGLLAAALVPVVGLLVVVLGALSESFRDRSLMAPSLLLALSTVAFAFAVPYGYGLSARGKEMRWLLVLAGATVADLIAVLLFGDLGATAVAGLWLATQTCLLVVVRLVSRSPAELSSERQVSSADETAEPA